MHHLRHRPPALSMGFPPAAAATCFITAVLHEHLPSCVSPIASNVPTRCHAGQTNSLHHFLLFRLPARTEKIHHGETTFLQMACEVLERPQQILTDDKVVQGREIAGNHIDLPRQGDVAQITTEELNISSCEP